MKSNSFAKKVLSLCKIAKNVAISGHTNPDYDALGSCIALREILRQNKISADIILEQPLDNTFKGFATMQEYVIEPQKEYDVVLLVDTAETKLIPANVLGLMQKANMVINIDHHQSNANYGKMNFVENRSSACEVLYYLFKRHFVLNELLAESLFIGIYTDTGGFVYSNTTKTTFLCLGELLDTGLDADALLRDCFRSKSLAAFEITKRAFASVKFYHDGQIAVSVLRENDFVECKANLNESKFIVPYLPTVEGVRVSISVSEPIKNDFHVSLRTAYDDVNVSLIAQKFGGGGHKRASGMTLKGNFDKALAALIAHAKYILENGEN